MSLKITIEPTDEITVFDGAVVRVWRGRTEGGVPCVLFVKNLAIERGARAEEFAKELKEQAPPVHVPLCRVRIPGGGN